GLMKRAFLVAEIAGAGVLGALAGFWLATEFALREKVDTSVTSTVNEAADTFAALQQLRDGSTNALVGALEDHLDMNIIFLRAFLDASPNLLHGPNYTNMLHRIRDYRI